MQSASNWLLLAVCKKLKMFFEKPFFFHDETNFWTFWEVLLFQLHPSTNFYILRFLQNQIFFEKYFYFIYYNQFLKVSRSLAFSVAFYGKFATFSLCLKKLNFFFSKNPPYCSIKKPNFWTFWIFSISQCHCRANLLLLAILKQSRNFSKTYLFFQQKTLIFERLRETYYIGCFLQRNCCL